MRLGESKPSLIVVVAESEALVGFVASVAGPVHRCAHVDEMRGVLSSKNVRIVIYEAGAFDQLAATEYLAALCVATVAPPILVCWRAGASSLKELERFVFALATAVAVHPAYNLKRELLCSIVGHARPSVATRALRYLQSEAGLHPVDHCVAAALAISESRRSVTDLSRAMGTSLRALSRHCRTSRLPRPVSLLGWGRALHVVSALEEGAESLQRIARAGGEATARECADYVRYHTGCAPTLWLRRGGFQALLRDFSPHVIRVTDRTSGTPLMSQAAS